VGQRAPGVAQVTMSRPAVFNAFDEAMIGELDAAFAQLLADDSVRVIVVTGAGDAFCSGGDLGRRTAETAPPTVLQRKQRLAQGTHKVALTMQEVDKPVIAAVNGAAVGAGMDMALMCDIRVAAQSARFSEGYIRVGLVPGNGGAYFLPRVVGTAQALEMLWTADFYNAEQALKIGLVNHVYDDETFTDQVLMFAAKIAAQPPVQVRAIKRTVYQSLHTDLRTSLELISSHMAIIQTTEDYREAINAYKEKRPGQYKGR